jgi:hypothetical protein
MFAGMVSTAVLALTALLDGQVTMDALVENALQIEIGGNATTGHFSADGGYSDSTGAAGSWSWEAGQLCLFLGDDITRCSSLPDDKGLGDSWSIQTPDGTPVTLTIIAG